MSHQSTENLARQVAHLEAQIRRLKRLALAFIGAAALLAIGAAMRSTSEIKTEALVLLDAEGRARASLDTNTSGSPTLAFFDKDGKLRMSIMEGLDGDPALLLAAKDGTPRLRLGIGPDSIASLSFWDQCEDNPILLSQTKDGTGMLSLRGKKGSVRLATGADVEYGLVFTDREGHAGLRIGLDDDGRPRLHLLAQQKERGVLSILPDGSLFLRLSGGDGKGGIQLKADKDGTPLLQVLDEKGESIFQVPPAARGDQ